MNLQVDGSRRIGAQTADEVEVRKREVDGVELIELRTQEVSVAIAPALGAKLVSLRDLRTQREWIWEAPGRAGFRRVSTGAMFNQGPLLGADECLPTIAACQWRGLNLPDHGEVWAEAWSCDESQLPHGRIVTRVQLPISPLSFERSITCRGSQLRLDYRLHNLSNEPVEYLWAFHPLLAIEPGDHIRLPADCARVRTDASLGGCPLGVRGDEWSWPQPVPDVDLARLDLGPSAGAVKVYTEPLSVGHAAIENDVTAERLEFAFDVRQFDTLGIWINRGGWDGYHHVALEPTNGAPDSLAVAVEEWGRFGVINARATREWGFTMRLSSGVRRSLAT